MNKIPVTKAGLERLEIELKHLKQVERPAIIESISEARAHGDLKENAEYHAAKEKQSFIEGRIELLESVVSRAEVIDISKLTGKKVLFGATVKLVDEDTEEEKTYQIVSEYEANLEEGRISNTSPIARALIGKDEGDSVNVATPGGKKSYEILEVKFIA
jgi:transcription elongation factor GreA